MVPVKNCSEISNGLVDFPLVSIVICTYNRKRLLKECLNSVFALDYPKFCYEIIIVDGGSNDGTEELCRELPQIRFVVERKHGLAYARNLGAELAQGSIVAYTDDDCVVDKKWLNTLLQGFPRNNLRVIGVVGSVSPIDPQIIPKKLFAKGPLGLFDEGNSSKFVTGFVASNCAFKREAFKILQFDESLGVTRRRNLLLSGEDQAFGESLIAAGYQIMYTPHARVYHNVPIRKLSVLYFVKYALHGGLSELRALLRKKTRIRALKYIVSGVLLAYFVFLRKRSIDTCSRLILSISTLIVCLTFLDVVSFS